MSLTSTATTVACVKTKSAAVCIHLHGLLSDKTVADADSFIHSAYTVP